MRQVELLELNMCSRVLTIIITVIIRDVLWVSRIIGENLRAYLNYFKWLLTIFFYNICI